MRRALPADLEAVVALTAEAYAVYIPVLGYPPVPVTEDYAPRIAAGEVWIQEENGEMTGLAVVETHEDHAMIFSLAVSPAAQGKGCGVAMLGWIDDFARARGLKEVRLYTNAMMERNIRIYQAYGYVEANRRPSPKRPQFTIVDMTRKLA